MKKVIISTKFTKFAKESLFTIVLLASISSLVCVGWLSGMNYQRYLYEQPNSEIWIMLESLPGDLVINFTAHISAINLTYTIPFTVKYNNSLIIVIVEGYLNTNVSFIEVSFRTNDTLMHFIYETASFYTYAHYVWFVSMYNDDSIVLAECRMYYTVQFFRSVM